MSSPANTKTSLILNKSDWDNAREKLRAEEKKLSKHKDEVSKLRKELSWTPVTGKYEFQGPNGVVTLKDLFGPYKKLVIYECMSFGNNSTQTNTPCGRCTAIVFETNTVHEYLNNNAECAVAVVCNAPYDKLSACVSKAGWTVPVYSCVNLDFTNFTGSTGNSIPNRYGPYKSRPGLSAFHIGLSDAANKNYDDTIYLTYNSYDRGCEEVIGYLGWIDRMPLNDGKRQPANFDWTTLHAVVDTK